MLKIFLGKYFKLYHGIYNMWIWNSVDNDTPKGFNNRLILIQKSLQFPFWHAPKLFSLLHCTGFRTVFVFSCTADSSIGDLVTDSLTDWVRDLLKNTTTEWPQRLVTFETFDQSYEETWPDQKKTKTMTNTETKTKTMTMTKTNTFRERS